MSVYVNPTTGTIRTKPRRWNRLPKWVTPERQQTLVRLFERSKGFCVFGHHRCLNPEHHYEVFIEGLIADWQSEDHQRREADWKHEERRIHHGEKGVFGRRFDPIEREVFMATRPEYYLRDTGVSVFGSVRPVALVRVPSTNIGLFVDVANAKALSKNKRRKMRRYGQEESAEDVDQLCRQAVAHWWSK